MKCNIQYIKDNEGLNYWCLSHKTKATEVNGKKPIFCDCQYKNRYKNIVRMAPEEIKNIKLIYPDLKNNTNVKLFINNKEFNGTLKIENSIIDLKDYGGLMLSKLNNIILESSKCPYCNGIHTDNGFFSYTSHSKHLCIYCGHLFEVKKPNIGNELELYFNFPSINLEDGVSIIDDKFELVYDLLNGKINVNNVSCKKVILDGNQIDLIEVLNDVLKNEY